MPDLTPDAMPGHAIAIVGMAGRFPGARDLLEFWQLIREGREVLDTYDEASLRVAGVSEQQLQNPRYVRKGTSLQGAEYFDAGFFGYSPREAQIIDPQQRVFLECAWEALEDAGYGEPPAELQIGVYGGASINTWLLAQVLRNADLTAAVGGYQLMLGNDKDFLCTRVSYKLNLRGPSMTIQTACSTSLVAVQVACRALQRGECDMALAGGVSLSFPQGQGYLYEEGMIFSPDGHCRPFDAEARGTRSGAGAGIVVLKRLADALADRDTIHAVIRGIAINNDGAGKAGFTAPSVDGQIEAIATAQALAAVDPRSISYIEAHGTATPLGDPIEIAALTHVFRASTPDIGFCRLGSLKANLGHLDAAAGVAGLIKTVLALKNRELPPLVNFQTPNPQLALPASPFVASAHAAPWSDADGPRRAAVSSFGIGGTNAHLVLEEAPGLSASQDAPEEAHLLVVSARTPAALDAASANLAARLRADSHLALRDVAWTLSAGRRAFPHRRFVVAADSTRAALALGSDQRSPSASARHEGAAPPVAFLFSGQGSQHPGMAAELYRSEAAFREALDRCASLLQPHLGEDIRSLVFGADEATRINDTQFAQPALFAIEYALASLWMSWGLRPAAMLGHSIGEYVAAHLAGVMRLEDALRVVAVRGRLMQAQPAGNMAAVHLSATELQPLLPAQVEIAAINAPQLCAVSGPAVAVDAFLQQLSARGIDARALQTSHAFHSAMMEPALNEFTALLSTVPLSAPSVPYVSNLTGTWITAAQATSPAYYARHLRESVRFADGVRALTSVDGVLLLEVGPGTALTSLARQCVGAQGAGRVINSLPAPRERRPTREVLLEAVGKLWLSGVELAWQNGHDGPGPRRVSLPTYPFERQRHFVVPDAGVAIGSQPAAVARAAQGQQSPSNALVAAASIEDWFWLPSWLRSLPLTQLRSDGGVSPGRWLVFAEASGPSAAFVRALQARGAQVVSVLPHSRWEPASADCFRIRPGEFSDYQQLASAVLGEDKQLQGIAHLWNIAEPCEDLQVARQRGFYSLLHLGRALTEQGHEGTLPLLVVSDSRETITGDETVQPARSLLLGPVLTLSLESPFLYCRNIDLESAMWSVERAPELVDKLLAEAARPEGDPLVGYRGGWRWTRDYAPISLAHASDPELPLRKGGTYLITGGTGGIGLSVARYLAEHWNANLILTGRSELPPRQDWKGLLQDTHLSRAVRMRLEGLLELEGLGASVTVEAADVADESQMSRVIGAAKARFGRIDGVMHAAGLLGNLTGSGEAADYEQVLRPKLEGTMTLDKLLAGEQLDILLLFSSISTALPTPGMSAYAAANAFLDGFARSGTARCTRNVIALGWDSWQDVGFAVQQGSDASHPALRMAIPAAEGIEALCRALGSALTHCYVSRRAIPRVLQDVQALMRWTRGSSPHTNTTATGHSAGAALQRSGAAGESATSDEERVIAAIWCSLLGLDAVDVQADFFALGGHSLLATRVLARIEESLGVRLTLRDIFDAPTVQMLALRTRDAGTAISQGEEREEFEF